MSAIPPFICVHVGLLVRLTNRVEVYKKRDAVCCLYLCGS